MTTWVVMTVIALALVFTLSVVIRGGDAGGTDIGYHPPVTTNPLPPEVGTCWRGPC
jgi:hypothetical protein